MTFDAALYWADDSVEAVILKGSVYAKVVAGSGNYFFINLEVFRSFSNELLPVTCGSTNAFVSPP